MYIISWCEAVVVFVCEAEKEKKCMRSHTHTPLLSFSLTNHAHASIINLFACRQAFPFFSVLIWRKLRMNQQQQQQHFPSIAHHKVIAIWVMIIWIFFRSKKWEEPHNILHYIRLEWIEKQTRNVIKKRNVSHTNNKEPAMETWTEKPLLDKSVSTICEVYN